MTQEELARLAGVGLSTLQSAEKGSSITLENLVKIAIALKCKPQDLFVSDDDRREISYAHVELMKRILEGLVPKN